MRKTGSGKRTSIYVGVGPVPRLGVGFVRMGRGTVAKGSPNPMPEHALEASRLRVKKSADKQNAARAGFTERAALARKKFEDESK